jgi:hypothetical protein
MKNSGSGVLKIACQGIPPSQELAKRQEKHQFKSFLLAATSFRQRRQLAEGV